MERGEFPDGARTLRAKIDMASPNINMRDPVMYRIKHAPHHRTGDHWCIYPTYDYTHGQSDSIEGITHSICTLEFENHRPLYDWFCEALGIHHPQQIEVRAAQSHLHGDEQAEAAAVGAGKATSRDGTTPGCRRFAACAAAATRRKSMRAFCERIGVAKFNSTIDMAWLEDAIRDDLNNRAPRAMGVLRPLKVVDRELSGGRRSKTGSGQPSGRCRDGHADGAVLAELYIEADDFMENAPKNFYRLAPGREVRLRYAYFITCTDVVKDNEAKIIELRLHVRPRHPRRQRAGRPQGEGDDPLGLSAARPFCGRAALRPPLQHRESG